MRNLAIAVLLLTLFGCANTPSPQPITLQVSPPTAQEQIDMAKIKNEANQLFNFDCPATGCNFTSFTMNRMTAAATVGFTQATNKWDAKIASSTNWSKFWSSFVDTGIRIGVPAVLVSKSYDMVTDIVGSFAANQVQPGPVTNNNQVDNHAVGAVDNSQVATTTTTTTDNSVQEANQANISEANQANQANISEANQANSESVVTTDASVHEQNQIATTTTTSTDSGNQTETNTETKANSDNVDSHDQTNVDNPTTTYPPSP